MEWRHDHSAKCACYSGLVTFWNNFLTIAIDVPHCIAASVSFGVNNCPTATQIDLMLAALISFAHCLILAVASWDFSVANIFHDGKFNHNLCINWYVIIKYFLLYTKHSFSRLPFSSNHPLRAIRAQKLSCGFGPWSVVAFQPSSELFGGFRIQDSPDRTYALSIKL